MNAFEEGSDLELQPLRAQLAAGLDVIGTRPSILTDRRRQLEVLARLLHGAGIRTIDPIGAHAVFAVIPPPAPANEDAVEPPHRNHELQVHLFARSGIRFMFARHPAHPGFVVRLPLALATYQDADLERIVSALTIATDLGDPAPALVPAVTDSIHPQYFGRYTQRD